PAPKPKVDAEPLAITAMPDKVTIPAGGETTVEITYHNPANLPGFGGISYTLPVGVCVTNLKPTPAEKKVSVTFSADMHTPASESNARIAISLSGHPRPAPQREFTIAVTRPEGQPGTPVARELRRLEGTASGLWAIAVTPDGRHVFASSA